MKRSSPLRDEFEKQSSKPDYHCRNSPLELISDTTAKQLKRFGNYSYIRLKILLIAKSQLLKAVLALCYNPYRLAVKNLLKQYPS